MPIDLEAIKRISKQPASEPTGVEALIHSIHRQPCLREFVTLESVALAPVAFKQGNNWKLVSLLAIPIQLADGSKGYRSPWGAVEWSWPEKKVTLLMDLRSHQDFASLRNNKVITALPPGLTIMPDPIEQARRQKLLYAALDKLLSSLTAEAEDLKSLADHYAGLLPRGAYNYYWVLTPGARQWLQPAASASTVTQTSHDEQAKAEVAAERKQSHAVYKPHASRERLDNLSEQIGPWLRRARALAESPSMDELAAVLHSLEARWMLPGFRLAFVGEFSRGKSTLINRLLGRPLLPIGVLPSTATVTSIVAGAEEKMEIIFPDNRRDVRSLQQSSWADLVAKDEIGIDRDVIAKVRLSVNSPWLNSIDVELVDTPGAGDLNEHRANLVFDLLSQCDSAVLLVSAAIPFSMTEAAFLEQQVIGRRIPCVLLVVSKLDTLAAGERAISLDVITERVKQVSANIPVLPASSVDDCSDEHALENIRTHIEAMVAKDERRKWRSRQVAGQLADHVSHLISVAETGLQVARMSALERQRALVNAQEEARVAETVWNGILLDLDKRRLDREQSFQKKIRESATELKDRLAFELDKAPDPKKWWERDLPFRLRYEMATLGRKSENDLINALAQDFDWLQAGVAKSFGRRMSRIPIAPPHASLNIKGGKELDLTDLQRFRFFTRVGSGAAMIGSFLLGVPIAALFSGAGLLAEPFFNNKLNEQRQAVLRELDNVVSLAINEYCNQVSGRLRQLYLQLGEEAKREQNAWQSAQQAAVKGGGSATGGKSWHKIIEQASALRNEILNVLEKRSE